MAVILCNGFPQFREIFFVGQEDTGAGYSARRASTGLTEAARRAGR